MIKIANAILSGNGVHFYLYDNYLENFISAKDIEDSNLKKAMLLNYTWEEVFDLSESLGIVADTTYDETKRILTEHFVPQRNMEFETFAFRQEAQTSKETDCDVAITF